MPLAALTFDQSAAMAPASTSASDMRAAFKAAVDDLDAAVRWTYTDGPSQGSSVSLLLAPPAGSPVPNYRLFLLFVATNGDITNGNLQVPDSNAGATGIAGFIYARCSTQGYDAGTAQSPFNGAAGNLAFGTGKNDSKVWLWTTYNYAPGGPYTINNIRAVASLETLCFRTRLITQTTITPALLFGAYVKSASDPNAALCILHTAGWTGSVKSNNLTHSNTPTAATSTALLVHCSGANGGHFGTFDPVDGTWKALTWPSWNSTVQAGSAAQGQNRSSQVVGTPIGPIIGGANPAAAAALVIDANYGILRGLYVVGNNLCDEVLLAPGPVEKGYVLSASTTVAGDAFAHIDEA